MNHSSIILVVCAIMGLGPKAVAEKPNILFCIADDASMGSFGAYGSTYVKTPAIDALAENGAVFNNAYNCNPKCAPARACLVTGRFSWQLKEAANHWPHFPMKPLSRTTSRGECSNRLKSDFLSVYAYLI